MKESCFALFLLRPSKSVTLSLCLRSAFVESYGFSPSTRKEKIHPRRVVIERTSRRPPGTGTRDSFDVTPPSLWVSPSLSLSLSLSPSVSVPASLSVSVRPCLSPSLSLFLSVSTPVSLSLSLSPSVSLSLSLFLSLPPPPSLSLSLSGFLSVSLYLPVARNSSVVGDHVYFPVSLCRSGSPPTQMVDLLFR